MQGILCKKPAESRLGEKSVVQRFMIRFARSCTDGCGICDLMASDSKDRARLGLMAARANLQIVAISEAVS
jgi:hypothetical protein